MNSPCANHPSRESSQICDNCSRSLCQECLGEPLGIPGRTFYFCFAKECDTAFRKRVLPFILLPLLALAIFVVLMFPLSKSSLIWLFVAVLSAAQSISYIRAYRQRAKLRPGTL